MGNRFVPTVALLILAISSLPAPGRPDEKKEPAPRQVIVVPNGSQRLQPTSKEPIAAVENERGKVLLKNIFNDEEKTSRTEMFPEEAGKIIRISPFGEPTTVVVTGLTLGTARITLVDRKGKRELCEIVVRSELFLPIDKSATVQLSSKKSIKKSVVEDEKIIRLESVAGDAASVKVTGRTAGDTRCHLTGEDGQTETFEVRVRSDKEAGKNGILLTAGSAQLFRLPGDKPRPIVSIVNSAQSVVRLRPADDPFEVVVHGIQPGIAQLEFTDQANKTEIREVVVRAEGPLPKDHIMIPIGQDYRLKHSKKQELPPPPPPMAEEKAVEIDADPKDDSVFIVRGKHEGLYFYRYLDADDVRRDVFFVVRKEKPKEKK